jgi:hypothetical protein
MSTLALILAGLLAAACVVGVALPFLREPGAKRDSLNEPDETARRRLALVEERDRALAALRELELDHRTGKVSDEDYRTLHASLRRQAAAALQAVSETSETGRPVAADGSRAKPAILKDGAAESAP